MVRSPAGSLKILLHGRTDSVGLPRCAASCAAVELGLQSLSAGLTSSTTARAESMEGAWQQQVGMQWLSRAWGNRQQGARGRTCGELSMMRVWARSRPSTLKSFR